MLADPTPGTKPFTLLRLLAVIAVVATLSAFAPWQAAPAMPPTATPPAAFPPLGTSWPLQQPRHHFIPPVSVKP